MDELRIYNTALTSNIIEDMFILERWAGKCKDSCATCATDNSACLTCKGNRILVGVECLCP